MSATPGLHLVLGDEDLLVERAVGDILRSARKSAGSDDVPVNRLRAGDVSTNELAELLSPRCSPTRVVVLESADEAGATPSRSSPARPLICRRAPFW